MLYPCCLKIISLEVISIALEMQDVSDARKNNQTLCFNTKDTKTKENIQNQQVKSQISQHINIDPVLDSDLNCKPSS